MKRQSKIYRQFPVRLELSLSNALDRYSEATRIPKTTISRVAIEKFLNELETSGIRGALEEVCTTWYARFNQSNRRSITMNFDKQKVINLIQHSRPVDMMLHQISAINTKSESQAIAAIKAEHSKSDSLLILTIRTWSNAILCSWQWRICSKSQSALRVTKKRCWMLAVSVSLPWT